MIHLSVDFHAVEIWTLLLCHLERSSEYCIEYGVIGSMVSYSKSRKSRKSNCFNQL